MRVLWCFPTSACIYFLSSPNCIYSNLLRDVLFLRTSLCYSVFYVGISAWNQSLYIYKNTDIRKRLCLIEVVCHHAGVGSIPARSMWDSLWPRGITLFPAKFFITQWYIPLATNVWTNTWISSNHFTCCLSLNECNFQAFQFPTIHT